MEAVMVSIAASLAAGILTEVAKKAAEATPGSTTVAGLKSAILSDLEPDIRLLEKELRALSPVLICAQSIDPMHYEKNDMLLLWLGGVKEAVVYADNLLDEIAYEKIRRSEQIKTSRVVKLLARSDTSFLFRMRISSKFKKFASLSAEIHKQAQATFHLSQLTGNALTATDQPRPPTIDDNLRDIRENPNTLVVMGRDADQELIINKLCSPQQGHIIPVIAIVGISGVGKTTLARMVYESETMKEHFGRRTWIFVSDNFRLYRFLDEMLQTITGKSHGLTNINAMEEMLKQCLQEEKRGYLLVLDDVWNTDEQLWKSVQSVFVRIMGSIRCRVLVTTQTSDVASLMGAFHVHLLKDLGDNDAWALFHRLAFVHKTEEQSLVLEDVGRRILRKCNGLPLAIDTMGSLLGSMNEKSEWESIERSEIWGLSLDQSKIMPWLLISFHHLRDTEIKQCFVHCSVMIEKGQTIEQSDLIRAWIAQGFISSNLGSDKRMEDIGETYAGNLVTNGLLQVFNVSKFRFLKMHDLVHDLARYISKDTIWISRETGDLNIATEAEHVRIRGEGTSVSVYSLPKDKTLSKLRTLICYQATLSIDFGGQAKLLRDLRLIDCDIWKVPSSIGRLKHLRYLSLRGNPFSGLPESIGTLFNLQTLDVSECDNFYRVPRKITEMVNLREILTSEKSWPISNLSCVKTLPGNRFIVGEAFEMKDLKSLESLSGDVEISCLHLSTCEEVAVEGHNLKAKTRIKILRLKWGSFDADGDVDASNDEGVMDGLQPHPNLKKITVDGFGGKRLSSWFRNMNNLEKIVLERCKHCKQLPTLGQLASLEKLHIEGMESLEVIGVEFYQNDSGGMSRGRILFPRLRKFRLVSMLKLRDWVEPSGYELFLRLVELEIRDCPMLSSAPTCFPCLSDLSIVSTASVMANNSRLWIGHVLESCSSLKRLSLTGNSKFSLIPNLRNLSNIYHVALVDFPHQTSIPECLSSLSSLGSLEIGGFNEELVQLDGAAHIPNGLYSLKLRGWPKLKCLPSELQRLYRLHDLIITEFEEIERLPEWLGQLSSLEYVEIRDCRNLKYLPSQVVRLTHLRSFNISGCPILEKMCIEDERKEWEYDIDTLHHVGRFH